MLLLDVNVVIAAHRVDHAQYPTIRPWFDDVLAGSEAFCVPDFIWASFIRLATSRRVFPRPTPLPEAFTFLEAVRAQPHHVPLRPGTQHLALLRRICEDSEATGDLVPDAVLAAIALEHDCVVASLDHDFARFSSIQHVVPGRS